MIEDTLFQVHTIENNIIEEGSCPWGFKKNVMYHCYWKAFQRSHRILRIFLLWNVLYKGVANLGSRGA
jgi:hypothetical protein